MAMLLNSARTIRAAHPRIINISTNRIWTRYSSGVTVRKPLFDKILIANRGEIACRVIRTAKKLGIKTVAVYSEPDRDALHVKMADEAYLLGPAASSESYLRMDKIVDVSKRSGAQAIHPGYGFLSENAEFSDLLMKEGITFIGPPASAIRSMGSKSESKIIMEAANVPVVPGYHGENQDPRFLKEEAARIGYPVLIKAIKGGGGKGMRIVNSPAEFDFALESAKRESAKSFGDDKVLIEKYLTTPRHVEVQVFADSHGNAVHLFERDCSVQRRHQKILEEAPAPGLSEELRMELGRKAVDAARAVNYLGAGTVEFIMDNLEKKFYFMEMNTRLQVEHPVTEMVTGTDLVHWQLEVAAGNPLPYTQEQLKLDGHAFEARIYAENPRNGFLPDTGPLLHVRTPEASPTVRLETGFGQGDQISVHYDPMIAKLVVKGEDRTAALRILRKALGEYEVVGLNTNIDFLKTLASHPAFIDGDVETGFIKKHEPELFPPISTPAPEVAAQAALSIILKDIEAFESANAGTLDPHSPWTKLTNARLNLLHTRQITFEDAETSKKIVTEVTSRQDGLLDITVSWDDKTQTFEGVRSTIRAQDGVLVTDIADRQLRSRVVLNKEKVHVFGETGKTTLSIPTPSYLRATSSDVAGSVKTPMPCKISQILVQPGQEVEKDQPLIILEAMKMEHLIKSPFPGKISQVFYKVGDLVPENKSLVAFQLEKEEIGGAGDNTNGN
ncbi:uncharacterized protein VTP21DRAFT_8561 [Calcarisporiella thermophila]|uniref:uncharacterized protein n=1 Tax=Calcarisporiella thermophila TaxID=911321 RepID=UPI0037434C60